MNIVSIVGTWAKGSLPSTGPFCLNELFLVVITKWKKSTFDKNIFEGIISGVIDCFKTYGPLSFVSVSDVPRGVLQTVSNLPLL